MRWFALMWRWMMMIRESLIGLSYSKRSKQIQQIYSNLKSLTKPHHLNSGHTRLQKFGPRRNEPVSPLQKMVPLLLELQPVKAKQVYLTSTIPLRPSMEESSQGNKWRSEYQKWRVSFEGLKETSHWRN